MNPLSRRDLLWIAPASLAFGALLSALQGGPWLPGWTAFSLLFLLSSSLLTVTVRRAVDRPSSTVHRPRVWNSLALLVTLAFSLRLMAGVASYILLPLNGYADPDDRAGYIFTDAHRRDDQAWELAQSDLPITNAFSERYAYDQYGGLLAFSAWIYRTLSPGMHRPLLLVLVSAFTAALGIPFLLKAARLRWGAKVAWTAGWIFALYPESVLLGGAAMREPYLMTFSAFALWGFVVLLQSDGRLDGGALPPSNRDPQGRQGTRGAGDRKAASRAANQDEQGAMNPLGPGGLDTPLKGHSGLLDHRRLVWIGLGLAGMLLVSPAIALVTLVILGGWWFLSSGRGRVPWWTLAAIAMVFLAGLLVLSSALDPNGDLGAATPFGVVNHWLREAVKWNLYKIEESSGWVQKLFDEMPGWLRLPFVMIYGVFQPVLPAAVIEPTTLTWKVIAILRAAGWYALLPALTACLVPGPTSGEDRERRVWLWIAVVSWAWILLAALRGGGDQWDNPRYRAILFVWQALAAAYALVRWREQRGLLVPLIAACEFVFLAVFTQWYASRYFHWGGQLPFAGMVALILGLWALILAGGWYLHRRSSHNQDRRR